MNKLSVIIVKVLLHISSQYNTWKLFTTKEIYQKKNVKQLYINVCVVELIRKYLKKYLNMIKNEIFNTMFKFNNDCNGN